MPLLAPLHRAQPMLDDCRWHQKPTIPPRTGILKIDEFGEGAVLYTSLDLVRVVFSKADQCVLIQQCRGRPPARVASGKAIRTPRDIICCLRPSGVDRTAYGSANF